LLVLATLASGREVVISRGELVEIGGSFRIPEILAASGARLVEVGTTNRTYIADYARAIGPETGLLLQVHPSNYEIRGFTAKPALRDIVALGRERGIPVVSDLGSGAWIDVEPFGFRREPLVRDVVAAGPDLVAFSGDKLLGGPQAGLILGREEAVRRVRAHPLFRCLRVDKMTLVLLEETLRLYRDPPRAIDELPALRALAAPIEEVIARAKRLEVRVNELRPMDASKLEIEIIATTAEMGSGTLPAQESPSRAIALRHTTLSANALARALRANGPPVFSRVSEDRVLLDVRTVSTNEENELARAIAAIDSRAPRSD